MPAQPKGTKVAGPYSQVDLDGMKACVPEFQSAIESNTTSLTSVQDQIQALEVAWTGIASRAFTSGLDQWLNDFRKVNESLQNVLSLFQANTGLLTNTNDTMHQVATASAQAMSSGISVGLPGI
jgi:WXG100 family type VII secretion target